MAYVGRKTRRGDPGIFGSILKLGSGLAKAFVPGYSTVSTAVSLLKGGQRKPPTVSEAKRNGASRRLKVDMPPMPTIGIKPGGISTLPSGTCLDDFGRKVSRPNVQDGTVIQRDDVPVTACPPGMRPNKSAYFRSSPGGTLIFQPPGTTCVKVRRRNPLNPRAFDRALSRVGSAKRFGEKLGRVTIRKKCDCGRSKKKK